MSKSEKIYIVLMSFTYSFCFWGIWSMHRNSITIFYNRIVEVTIRFIVCIDHNNIICAYVLTSQVCG